MRVYRLVDEKSPRHHVSRWCRALGVSRSGFYEWRASPISDRDLSDAALLAVIDQIFAESRGTYGSPRVHAELRLGHSIRVGKKRVERLMRRGRLVAVSTKRRRGSTQQDPDALSAPDLVERDFSASGPDELWIADFTQVTTWQGIAYIAVVADAYSRLCLGWRVRPDKTVDLVLEALEMAIWRRGQMQAQNAVHHSDQGSQGGFNWSSQHLVMEVVGDECWQASAGDSCDAWAGVVAGPAVGRAARGSAAVLAGDRGRALERRRGWGGGRVGRGGCPVVSRGWRDAISQPASNVGSLLVVC